MVWGPGKVDPSKRNEKFLLAVARRSREPPSSVGSGGWKSAGVRYTVQRRIE